MIDTNSSIYKKLQTPGIFIVLAIVLWVAYFWHFQDFGIYEDDHGRIAPAMIMSGKEFMDSMMSFLRFEETQGRPLHPILIHLFAFLGAKLGGLKYVHIFGYGITLLNSILFYLLLKNLYKSQFFAFAGSISFCLFPADTTKIFLTHSLGVQPSITFLLLAFLCYISGKTKLSYLFLFTTLLAYETVFPIFFVAPLLCPKEKSKILQDLIRHGIIMALMIVVGIVIRKATGESVSSFNVTTGVLLFANPILGPITSTLMYFYRSLETLFNLNVRLLAILLCSCFSLTLILYRLKANFTEFESYPLTIWERKFAHFLKLSNFSKGFARPLFHGFIMLILAYPLTLTTLGITINGRGTRVHTAAILGSSILCACACSLLVKIAVDKNKKLWSNLFIATFFSLLVGFGLNVQQDYQMSWQFQRGFWTDLVELCPDLESGTVIFVEPTSMRDTRQLFPGRKPIGIMDTRQIKANDWTLPLILEHLYEFPNNWEIPPRVYRLLPSWQDKILSEDNLFQVSASIPFVWDGERQVDPSKVIFLETKNQELTRRSEPLVINNKTFELKQNNLSPQQLNSPWEKTIMYDYFVAQEGEKLIEYLLQEKN